MYYKNRQFRINIKPGKNIIVLFLVGIGLLYPLQSQVLFKLPKKDTVKQVSPVKELQDDLESLLDNKQFDNSFIGISVIAPETNEVLFQKNENKNFIPASNEKLLTTATALRYLGADYKFQTRIYLDGDKTETGEFNGDIYIRGFGDPSLSNYFYENPFQIFHYFTKILDSLGIKIINGDIIGDDNFFDDLFYAPGWQLDDIIYPYSAQINALSILDNKVEITIESGLNVGEATTMSVYPDIKYVNVTNQVLTSESEEATNIYAVKDAFTNDIKIYGNISYDSVSLAKHSLSVSIYNPTLFFLYVFKDYLDKNNISHKGALADIDDLEYLPDYTFFEQNFIYFSPKLSEIIKIINRESHNLAAEMLLKTIARETSGFGSTSDGIEQVKKYLEKIGLSSDKIFIVDGSGLSRLNMLTPSLLTSVLNNLYKSEHRNLFWSSLAAPSENGTMKRRLTKSAAAKRVRAKTGTMNNVSTISGYVKSRDDEIIIFSVLVNNFTVPLNKVHNLQDLICMRLAGFTRYPERFQDK